MKISLTYLRAVAVAGGLAATLSAGFVATAQAPVKVKSAAQGAATPGVKAACPQGRDGGARKAPPRFEDLDTDGDGKLSEAEAAQIPPVIEQGFAAFDTDANGYLSQEELPAPPGHGRGGHRPPDFAQLDVDGSGALSREEAEQIPPVRDEGFDTFDTNQDGSLSEAELPAPPRHGGQDRRGGHDRQGPPNGVHPPRFEDSDVDGDGKLSAEEAAGIRPVDEEGFDTFDADGDGYLTREELPAPPRMGPQARTRPEER